MAANRGKKKNCLWNFFWLTVHVDVNGFTVSCNNEENTTTTKIVKL